MLKNRDQPEEARPELKEAEADQIMIPVELPDLEPRLGYEPIDEPRQTGGQRATPVEEMEKAPVNLARPKMEVIIGRKMTTEMCNR